MEQSPHVLMTGEGAEVFARQKGVELVDPKYFYTEERWQQLQKAKDDEKSPPPKRSKLEREATPLKEESALDEHKFGTVGAVCLDKAGNLGAGTSTGGMTNKRFGRVGDSPIIGAGTYANNETCAVSCTGDGEYFIRTVVAHDVSAQMQYGGKSLAQAAEANARKSRQNRRNWRAHKHRPARQFRDALQHFRHVPRLDWAGRGASCANIRRLVLGSLASAANSHKKVSKIRVDKQVTLAANC